MNDPNSTKTSNIAVGVFDNLRVSNRVEMTGLRRKTRAEDSDGADQEEDTIRQQKTRRKVDPSTSYPPSILTGKHGSHLVTFHQGEASFSDSANNFYDSSALLHATTNTGESTEVNLGKVDYALTMNDEEKDDDDTESAIWWNKDHETGKRIASSIILRKPLEIMAAPTSFLPNEVVIKIFDAIIRLPRELDSRSTSNRNSQSTSHSIADDDYSGLYYDTNDEVSENLGRKEFGKDNDGLIEAICFALTCPRYWTIFRDLWCYSNTNKIIKKFGLSMPQELVLAPLLETWMGGKYRRSNLLTMNPYRSTDIGEDGSQGYINLFLSRRVYGEGDNERDLHKEQSLWNRHKARSQILDFSGGDTLKSFLFRGGVRQNYPKIPLPSLFSMGSSWYLTAAKRYRDIFISWQFEYSDFKNTAIESYSHSIGPHSYAMYDSWKSFQNTTIFDWVKKIQSPTYSRHRPFTQVQDESLKVATEILELHRDATQSWIISDLCSNDYEGISEDIPTNKWEKYADDIMFLTTYFGNNLWEPELCLYE